MRPAESFIGQPIRSLQTMLQVIGLDDNRIPKVIPDGIYGQNTLNAVNRFQQIYGLPLSGITDQATWDLIVQVYEDAQINIEKAEPIEIIMDQGYIMELGDSGSYVYFVQIMLLQLSCDHPSIMKPPVNGIYDEDTMMAVKSFQALSNLPQTGIINKKTWKNLVKQFTLNTHHNLT